MSRPRVTVLGAGIVGAACARHLADAGARVRVHDPGAGRAAASWAAAGILSASHPELLPGSVHALGTRSRGLWDDLAARHPEVELRRIGQVLLGDEPGWIEWRRARGLATEALPDHRSGATAHLFPEVAVVRPPRAVPALLEGIPVETGPVPELADLRAAADLVVIATGAWAAPHLAAAGLQLAVAPRRGQMLLFSAGDLDTVVIENSRDGVAVPRADGRVVTGTTLEDAGFVAETVAEDLDRLEAWARSAVPGSGVVRTPGPGCARGRPGPRR